MICVFFRIYCSFRVINHTDSPFMAILTYYQMPGSQELYSVFLTECHEPDNGKLVFIVIMTNLPR